MNEPKSYTGDLPFLYFSFHESDRATATAMITALVGCEYRLAFNEGTEIKQWGEIVSDRIRKCEGVLVLMSQAYADSGKCQAELIFAQYIGKQAMIVYTEDVELPEDLAPCISSMPELTDTKLKAVCKTVIKTVRVERTLTAIAKQSQYCQHCGSKAEEGAKYCPYCGSMLYTNMLSYRYEMTEPSAPPCGQTAPMPPSVPCASASLGDTTSFAVPKVHEARPDCVQFSALAPKNMTKGDYTMLNVVMYEEAYRKVVKDMLAEAEEPMQEARSGVLQAADNTRVRVELFSPDLAIEDAVEEGVWRGKYLNFSFAVFVPEDYAKRQILFTASVYFNDVIAVRLKFIVRCRTLFGQKIEVIRENVLTAFVSYASADRARVASLIQGMRKARPDMNVFFDVDSLRSGEMWEQALYREIEARDVLFLCWSSHAKNSEWVDREWRYALKVKGIEGVEPIPLESPQDCPPPDELSSKHFNDSLLRYMHDN